MLPLAAVTVTFTVFSPSTRDVLDTTAVASISSGTATTDADLVKGGSSITSLSLTAEPFTEN